MNCANIYSSQDIDRRNLVIKNIEEKGMLINQRLVDLHLRKKNIDNEFSLEKDIEIIDPSSPYKELIPSKSYATLNISRYATNGEIYHAHKKLQTTDIDQNLVVNEAMRNITEHQKIKDSYRSLTNILHGSYSKARFINDEDDINKSDKNIHQKYGKLLQSDEINATRRKNLIEKLPATMESAIKCTTVEREYNRKIKIFINYSAIFIGSFAITKYALMSMNNSSIDSFDI